MGRTGVPPLCFSKSGEVALNQEVADWSKTRVCRRLKRMGLREGVRRGSVRSGKVTSRTSIAQREVLVNNDLGDGNSNEAAFQIGRFGNVPSVPGFCRISRSSDSMKNPFRRSKELRPRPGLRAKSRVGRQDIAS
jgi:hypothetical protein